MADLKGPPAELRATLTITRKATGKVEEYQIVGKPIPEPEPAETLDLTESDDGSHA